MKSWIGAHDTGKGQRILLWKESDIINDLSFHLKE